MSKKVTGGQKKSPPKKQAGGKRKGAGRPKGEPTTAIGVRVPAKWHKQITALVRAEVKRLSEIEAAQNGL